MSHHHTHVTSSYTYVTSSNLRVLILQFPGKVAVHQIFHQDLHFFLGFRGLGSRVGGLRIEGVDFDFRLGLGFRV